MKIASQVEAAYCFEIVVHGHHIYKTIWTPSLGEILMVYPEPLNYHDRHAVCIKKDDVIIGADRDITAILPREQTKTMWDFLMHGGHVSCEVTGRRKLGNGLEVPCTYKLTGKEKLVSRMQELLSKQRPDPRVLEQVLLSEQVLLP